MVYKTDNLITIHTGILSCILVVSEGHILTVFLKLIIESHSLDSVEVISRSDNKYSGRDRPLF